MKDRAAKIKEYSRTYLSPHYNFFYPDIVFERANSIYIYDSDGEKYIDCTSGESFFNLGHNHPAIVRAMKEQMETELFSICGCNFMHAPQALLAKALAETMPKELRWKVFFTNSGTESIEGAIKLARYETGRKFFIAFKGAFHGRTMGALGLTYSHRIQHEGFDPELPVQHLPFGDIVAFNNFLQTRNPIYPLEVAAVVLEPIQGYGGINVSPPGFLQAVRNFCDRYGMLMILDEIQTGLGRTGKMWAFEHDRVIPDIVCTAKSLGGGLPLGAVIAKREIMDSWKPGSHGSSGGGNPIGCAAGIKLLSILNHESVLEFIRGNGEYFIKELKLALYPNEVTGRGYMVGIEFQNTEVRDEVVRNAANRGLIMLKANRDFRDRSIRLLPPLTISRGALDAVVDILKASVSK